MVPPTTFQRWLLAARPRTLYAAVAPVVVGTAMALEAGKFRLWPAAAALLGAVLIQIGTNLANDVADFRKGADTQERLGPIRVTQAGLLTPTQVLTGMWICFGMAGLIGLYLTYTAGWPVVIIGILSIAAGIAYTGGPLPLGYHGLGDVAVFVFFGLVAVGGTYFVQAEEITLKVWLAATPMGFLSTAILVVNNLRDLPTDRKAGKRTLAVRLGRTGTLIEYVALMVGAYLVPVFMWLFDLASPAVLLTWISIPMAYRLSLGTFREVGKALNPILGRTGVLELVYSVLFSVGVLL